MYDTLPVVQLYAALVTCQQYDNTMLTWLIRNIRDI